MLQALPLSLDFAVVVLKPLSLTLLVTRTA